MGVIIGSILFALALLWTGDRDYQDAQAEHRHYCIMVASGYWPDYDERDCGEYVKSDRDNVESF